MVNEATAAKGPYPENLFILSLDFPVSESPVQKTKAAGVLASLIYHTPPDTMSSLTNTVTSLTEFVLHGAIKPPRLVETSLQFGVAGLGSLARHENAHFYILTQENVPYDRTTSLSYERTLVDIAGINANLRAAEQILLEPYQPVASELNEIAASIDLPVYYLIQQKLLGRRNGDLARTFHYQKDHSLENTEAWTAVLGVWSSLDLFWSKEAPVRRVLRYAFGGATLNNPHSPGDFSFKTTGDLSPFGPMFGLRSSLFLEERSHLPSVVTAKFAASPARRSDTIFPFMMSVGAERISLFDVASVGVALSASVDLAVQNTKGYIDTAPAKDDLLVLAARGGLHFLTSWGEISLGVRYKKEGFLPNASPLEEVVVWGGLRFLLENLSQP